MECMNNRQKRTLEAIFSQPVPKDLVWAELESLFMAIGAEKREMAGSRVRFTLAGIDIAFHRPHNPQILKPYQIGLARDFLEKTGVKS